MSAFLMASAGALNSLSNIVGTTGADSITGTTGANIIDGGIGSDTMVGLAGNDIYIVDSTTDVITETNVGGFDSVVTSVSYTLPNHIEQISTESSTGVSLTANSLANVLKGNVGNDTLNGSSGADTAIGMTGNDVYILDNVADIVIEKVGEGIDEVQTFNSYTLPSEVENLTLTGISTASGSGNSLNNVLNGNTAANAITGNAGDDTINGSSGNDNLNGSIGYDLLIGGMGTDTLAGGTNVSEPDTFKFNSISEIGTATTRDVINDFKTGVDIIDLTALGTHPQIIGTSAFSATNQIRWSFYAGYAVVQGNIGGGSPSTVTFEIKLLNVTALDMFDFYV